MRLFATIVLIFILDQATKIYVRTNFHLYESIQVIDNWLKFTLTENPGIAFGLQFGPRVLLTAIAIIATTLIILYLIRLKTAPAGYRMSLAFIIAGALGNVFDRVFYGKIFGYADWFYGNVVDFIHIDLWRGHVPESIPFLGGKYLALLPIWNIADMSIVFGVILILYYQRQLEADIIKYEMDQASNADDPENKIENKPENKPENRAENIDDKQNITESTKLASKNKESEIPPAESESSATHTNKSKNDDHQK